MPVDSARRARVLFVDDQKEVAKTLSGLLPRDRVEARFASSGEEGLTYLLNEIFDLAIIDLRMPPGHWGGLWLLQQLSNRGLSVDTLVLSGEAGQSETIDAMRLGALDFVVKENVSTELVDRVMSALSRGPEIRSAWASNEIPAPIALPYQRMQVPRDVDAQLRASLITAEAAFRFCALTAVAVARGKNTLKRSLSSRFARPSLGDWRDLCRTLRPQVVDHPLGRWIAAVCNKEADAIVRFRNDTVHGGGVPSGGATRALSEVIAWLDFFFLAVRSGIPVELVVAGPMISTGSNFRVEWTNLAGAARSVAWLPKDVPNAPVTNRVYMRSAANDYVDMCPLILASPLPEGPPGDWNVAIMDGFRQDHRGEVSDSDRLRYIDTSTGVRSISPTHTLDELFTAHQTF